MNINHLYDIKVLFIRQEHYIAGMKAKRKARAELSHYQRAIEKFNQKNE